MWQYLSEILIAVIAVSGPIILLLIRQHYKLKNIDHALNNVELDLVDGQDPGQAPSIRQKLNDISSQLENSIVSLENDRRLDRFEAAQHRQVLLHSIEDIKNDIKDLTVLTLKNTEDIKDTRVNLIRHIEEEQSLLTKFIDGRIDFEDFVERAKRMQS